MHASDACGHRQILPRTWPTLLTTRKRAMTEQGWVQWEVEHTTRFATGECEVREIPMVSRCPFPARCLSHSVETLAGKTQNHSGHQCQAISDGFAVDLHMAMACIRSTGRSSEKHIRIQEWADHATASCTSIDDQAQGRQNAHGLACQHLDVHAQTTMPQTLCQLNDHFVGSRSHSSGPFRRCPFAHDRGQGSTWCHTALSGAVPRKHNCSTERCLRCSTTDDTARNPTTRRSRCARPPRNRKTRPLHRHLAQTLGQILLLARQTLPSAADPRIVEQASSEAELALASSMRYRRVLHVPHVLRPHTMM